MYYYYCDSNFQSVLALLYLILDSLQFVCMYLCCMMVWSKLQDRILPCLDRHWDMKAYSNTDVVSNKNRTIWKQLGITLFLRHLTTQERKECCCCAALLAAAACMKCQWDICYALLRELLVILLADRFDYYLVRHFFPLSHTGNLQ